jgi:hypothetical protein
MKTLFQLLAPILLIASAAHAQSWSGIISAPRATDWSTAGIPGGIPSATWTQCGATIAAYGTSGSPSSPATINSAIAACGTHQFVLLGSGDFYLNGAILFGGKSHVVLRGMGPNLSLVHFMVSPGGACNGIVGVVCMVGGNGGFYCNVNIWPCPLAQINASSVAEANWTSGYSQGSSTIVVSAVAGITLNVTPIILDQCDDGYSGNGSNSACVGSTGGNITVASVVTGGSGYAINDTFSIPAYPGNAGFGKNYGAGATGHVTSVSGSVVTGIAIDNAGGGYTYSGNNGTHAPTTTTSGGGSGLVLGVTGISAYDTGSMYTNAVIMVGTDENPAGTSRSARQMSETDVATACVATTGTCASGTGPYTLTLSHPLVNPNWSSARSPQIWWSTGGPAITDDGVENLMLDGSPIPSAGAPAGVVVMNASYVWAYRLTTSTFTNSHFFAFDSTNMEIRDNYSYWTTNNFDRSYGIGLFGGDGNFLVINNIGQGIVDPLNVNGACSACVFSYNFGVNQFFNAGGGAAMFATSANHAAGVNFVLSQGNIGASVSWDIIHGGHDMGTFFRNYWNGYEPNNGTQTTQNTVPVSMQAYSRYANLIGNILGTATYHTHYDCSPTTPTQLKSTCYGGFNGYTHIYELGWSSGGGAQIDYGSNPNTPNDPITGSSSMRWGNCDTVTGTCRFVGAEVPTADPNFPVTVPASNALPASFYDSTTAHASCGTGLPFWKNPTSGACPPYPSVGPDVTTGAIWKCTSGTYLNSLVINPSQCAGGTSVTVAIGGGNTAAANPAMVCYFNQMSGKPDGTAPILTFNPAACYAPDNGIGTITIAPTSLAFGIIVRTVTSSGMSTTLTNSSGGSIAFTSTTFTGTNGSDFAASANTCTGTLVNSATCTVTVKFTPSAAINTAETATLNVAYTGFAGSPLTVALTGTSGGIIVSPTSLAFGTVTRFTTSSGISTVLTNNAGVTITGLTSAISGTNASDFSFSVDGCSGISVVNGGTCTDTVLFSPTASPTTVESATLSINFSGASGSPELVTLGGTSGAPGAAATPSCAPGTGSYGSPQSVTCSVAGGAPVICYTTNGATPATNSTSGCTTGTLVSGAISIIVNTSLKVIAGGTGFTDGSVATFVYTFTTAPPPAPCTTCQVTIPKTTNTYAINVTNRVSFWKKVTQSHTLTVTTGPCTCSYVPLTGATACGVCPQTVAMN